MLERRSGCLAKARVIIGAAPGASQRDGHVRYVEATIIIIVVIMALFFLDFQKERQK